MKSFQILLLIIVFIASGCSSKNKVIKNNKSKKVVSKNSNLKDLNQSLKTNDINITVQTENNNSKIINDLNITKINKKEKTLSLFEKLFVNHLAYNHYKKAIKLMYEKKHKLAYKEAMIAKNMYDNSLKKEKIIDLPYIPGYIRQSAQAPRRVYYKILKKQVYEIDRLIRKIKLLNPPIASIVLNKTSTYIDISITNDGDLPFDNFIIEINYEKVASFDKIAPKETKTFRYYIDSNIEQISFKEEYGFAPAPIELTNEGE